VQAPQKLTHTVRTYINHEWSPKQPVRIWHEIGDCVEKSLTKSVKGLFLIWIFIIFIIIIIIIIIII
jgi:hypothetical protein